METLVLSACVGTALRDGRVHCFIAIEGSQPFRLAAPDGVEMEGHCLLNFLRGEDVVTAVVVPPVYEDEQLSLSLQAGAIRTADGVDFPAATIACVNNSTRPRPPFARCLNSASKPLDID